MWSRNRAVQYMYVTVSYQFQCEMYDIYTPISKYIPNIRHFNTPFVENVMMKLKTIRCNLHDTFTFSIVVPTKQKINQVKKINRGGWTGFGTATVGIDPNTFEVLNGHPTKIPTDEILGGVVQNCRPFECGGGCKS